VKRQAVDVCAHALLDRPDGPLNFADVVIMGREVKPNRQKFVIQAGKLDVRVDGNHFKTAGLIHVEDDADAVKCA
jgi:hypothetical protein